ncbi:MAG: hypothetical protein PHR44_04760 [Candidatus Omnitrophica bacterium]|nr:hypothetical protein [Candidatus Omnitrophota bacterium]
MIHIDFDLGVAFYLLALLIPIFLCWFFLKEGSEKKLFLDPKFIWFCSICTYTYINTKDEQYSLCPRCGCYNTR